MTKERCYIYTRVSTVLQTDGYSLDAQEVEIKKYCEVRKISVCGIYCDAGVSGKTDQRPQFQKMLSDIKSGKDNVNYVCVYKLSRFGRNAHDVVTNLSFLQTHNVNLICTKDGLDSSTNMGKLLLTIMSAVAEMELENIHEFTLAGRYELVKSGWWGGGFAPYGYSLSEKCLYIEPEEAAVIKQIFELYTTTSLGINGVAKKLNALGIKKKKRHTAKHEHFTTSFVKNVLDNPVYCGKIAYGRRKTKPIVGTGGATHIVKETDPEKIIIVNGKHEAIVSEEMYMEAQVKRKQTGKKKERIEKEHEYLLSSLICCPGCGKRMYGVPNRKKKPDGSYYNVSYAYKCRQKKEKNGNSCAYSKQYNCREIDDEFYRAIALCFTTPEIVEQISKKLNESFDSDDLTSAIEELQARLNKVKMTIKVHEDKQAQLDIFDKHYEKRYENFNRQLENFYDQLAILENEVYQKKIALKNRIAAKKEKLDALELLIQFGVRFDTLPQKIQKDYVNALIDSIEIFPDKRDMGYLKKIHFKIPVNIGTVSKCVTGQEIGIWDLYPQIVDENGFFTDCFSEHELDVEDQLPTSNGIVPVIDENDAEAIKEQYGKLFEYYNRTRKYNEMPEIDFQTFYEIICRPKTSTVETVVLLSQRRPDTHIDIKA